MMKVISEENMCTQLDIHVCIPMNVLCRMAFKLRCGFSPEVLHLLQKEIKHLDMYCRFYFGERSYDVQIILKTLSIALNTKKSNTKKSGASLELLLTLMERDKLRFSICP